MKNTFESRLGIGELCIFYCKPFDNIHFKSLSDEKEGKIVAVRFTETKVLYDILDIDYCHLYRDITSDSVRQLPQMFDKIAE